MSDHGHAARHDHGFALSELIVVLALVGVVLGGAYSFSYAVTSSARVNEFQATAARETGNALWMIEKNLMQEIKIESTTPYRIQFITDPKLDGNMKRHIVEAKSDGTIALTTWATTAGPGWPNAGSPNVAVLAHHSSNVTDGVALFKYHRGDATLIEGSEIAESARSQARAIRVVISVAATGRTHKDSRFIKLRNRE